MSATPSAAGELDAERTHLAHARVELARMRERTLGLRSATTDWVAAEIFEHERAQRAESLTDDGGALFFGRIDVASDRWYIGRRHIYDTHGDPVVLDWRAEMSTRFYRATPSDPMQVDRRRRFGIDHGEITAYEDEMLTAAGSAVTGPSAILAQEIERPRVGPMRDIVATIQPEQDVIVRTGDTTTLCIQGAPGTGKTAVGLHRAAWLLYAFREKFTRSGVLVIGPNAAFLEHIGQVLPALGEVRVQHATVESLVTDGRWSVRTDEAPDVAVLKGDARMARVLRRALWSQIVRRPSEALVVPRGVRKWRVPAYEIADDLDALLERDIRYDAARRMMPQRLAHRVLVLMEADGQSPDDRVQDAVARTPAVKAYASSVWPELKPREVLYRLFSDAPWLAEVADGLLAADEQRMLIWDKPPRSAGSARWSPADVVLLDELADLLERTTSLGHVIVDEAQDLSAMQLRAVGRRCSTGSATVLGDIAQGTTPWAARSWEESLTHLGKEGAQVEELVRGFRVPALVIEYAARLLPLMAPGLRPPESVRANPGRLTVEQVDQGRLAAAVTETVQGWLSDPGRAGSIGVIVPDVLVSKVSRSLQDKGIDHGVLGDDHGDVDHRVDVVPATVAKGLEFDLVLVAEPAAIVAAEPDERTGLRRLYVVLTRAVSELAVVHTEVLPDALVSV